MTMLLTVLCGWHHLILTYHRSPSWLWVWTTISLHYDGWPLFWCLVIFGRYLMISCILPIWPNISFCIKTILVICVYRHPAANFLFLTHKLVSWYVRGNDMSCDMLNDMLADIPQLTMSLYLAHKFLLRKWYVGGTKTPFRCGVHWHCRNLFRSCKIIL